VFRANFNYNTAAAQGNGLEPPYTPRNVNGQAIFPYVTTSDAEIVAYVLRSNDATKNGSSISLYLDDFIPRSVFPSTINPPPAAANPSRKEDLVTIGGIDTTNANPPYTLYRMTLADVKNGALGTPVAENIRSLNFAYYTDGIGSALLTDSAGGQIPTGCVPPNCTGAIGGDGQYDPDNIGGTPKFADRNQRALIQSIRVNLVGMNASPDLQGYTNPTETIPTITNYRQYSLSSLVVPRNLGKTGFPEPMYQPPAPPTITGMCTGHCGAPVIYWTAPAGGGPVLQYMIAWDTSPSGAFAAPHQAFVNDPAATSFTIPDDGIFDVSQTWYYRMTALNDNGSSAPSNLFTAVPKNSTKPTPPSTLVATDKSLSNAQTNQITLTWTSPTQNDPSKDTLSCSAGTGSTNGLMIPNQEIIKYRVWRGTTPDFTLANGARVLKIGSTSQPPGAVPGSTITWVDSASTSELLEAPASCTQYYYRIQAIDRCFKQSNWEVSGNTADSQSTVFPPVNGTSNAIPGSTLDSVTTPNTPLGLKVDTSPGPPPTSGCPDPVFGGSYCKIVLLWKPVNSDTSGNAIGVDVYRITRSVKHQNNIPSNGYTLDTSFGTGGKLDVPGFTQMLPDANGNLTWTDTTALVADPVPPFMGSAYSYEYTVAAKRCTTYSGESNTADYPTPCTINPTIIQAGASNPSASGDTPPQAWIMNAGDTITVTPPGGTTFSNVNFKVTTWPAGAPVDSQTVAAPGPYIYTWSDRVDGQIYQVTITVTEATPNAGCTEVHVKYVQDQATAPCAFANISPVPAPSLVTSQSNTTASNSFTVTNTGTDPIQFNILTPAFQGQATENWTGPTVANPTLTAISTTWNPGNQVDNYSITTTPFTRFIPATMANVLPGTTFTVTVRWQFKKTEPNLTASPLQKLCISYRIPSEPGTTKFCNLVGQSATTNNPNACD
jgi:hypothetical protein